MIEDAVIKILWDFNIHTDNPISARRPDIIIIHKKLKSGTIIDINCPNDTKVTQNEIQKMAIFTELKIELERVWQTNLQVVPIVVGCLGAISKKLPKFINKIGLYSNNIAKIQKIGLLESARILRKYVAHTDINP